MVIQGEMARAEAAEIMLVDHNILKDDTPIIEFVQNPVIAAYILTDSKTRVREDDANQMLMCHMQWHDRFLFDEFRPVYVDKEGYRYYTGHQVFSCILPRDFYMDKAGILIERGVMLKGQWKKKSLNGQGGLIHTLVRDYGGPFTADFITGTYNFLSWYETSVRGFTVALDDCWVPRAILGVDALKEHTEAYFQQCAGHDIEAKTQNTAIQEANLCAVVDRVRDVMGRRAQEYFKALCARDGHRNGLEDLITSGAKGSAVNEVQIAACIGQQRNHRSKRFPLTTSHFTHPDACKTQSNGMVFNNFMTGMDPIEMFFHLCASHSGLVDTSVKSVTGDTELVIIVNGQSRHVTIGEWVDEIMADPAKVLALPDQELAELTDNVLVPSMSNDGKMMWAPVTAVTRHDPSEFLYEITTQSGRSVTVVESKSLLVWHEESKAFVEKNTSEVYVGDYLPTCASLPEPPEHPDFGYQQGHDVAMQLIEKHQPIPSEYYSAPTDCLYAILETCKEQCCETDFDGDRLVLMSTRKDVIDACAWVFLCTSSIFERSCVNGVHRLSMWCIRLEWTPQSNCADQPRHDPRYQRVNDVVLDRIVSMRRFPAAPGQKVYDLTVPSTLNFGLANGLQVRDTAFTGYMQRRIAKSMEDMVTDHAGRVVNTSGDVVQIQYGGDGFIPTCLESDPLTLFPTDGTDWRVAFEHPATSADELREVAALREQLLSVLLKNRDRSKFNLVFTPVHMHRVMHRIALETPSTPVLHAAEVQTWRARVFRDTVFPVCKLNAKLRLYFLDHLSTRRLMDWPATPARLERLEERIARGISEAQVPRGEFVGQHGAQSIGEPLTQMTLDAFHSSGAFSTLTSGVPRVGELINAVSRLSTPSMHIYVKPDEETGRPCTREQVERLGVRLIQHTVNDFIARHEMNPADRARYEERLAMFESDAGMVPELDTDEPDAPDDTDELVNDEAPDGGKEEGEEDEEEAEDEEEEAEEEEEEEAEEEAEEEEAEAEEEAEEEAAEEEEIEEPDEEEPEEEDDAEDEDEDQEAADEDEVRGNAAATATTTPSPVQNRIFSADPNHFILVLHLKPDTPVRLEELAARCKRYVNMESLCWAYGRDDQGAWIAVGGCVDDAAIKQWILSMNIHGCDAALIGNVLREHIGNTPACGVRNMIDFFVSDAPFPVVDPTVGAITWEDRYFIVTRGTNLRQVMQLPWVDTQLTFTNDVLETERVFGIDVAKQMIQNELLDVMSACGASVRARHLSLLAERMTQGGRVVPTTYSGICLPGTSVMRNASFEYSIETFLNGALKGEYDACQGMTECVIVNRDLQGGTGLVKLVNQRVPPDPVRDRRLQQHLARQVARLIMPSQAWMTTMASAPVNEKPPLRPILKNAPAPVNPTKNTMGTTSASRRRKRALQGRGGGGGGGGEHAGVFARPVKRQVLATTGSVAAEVPVVEHGPGPAVALPRFCSPGIAFVAFDRKRELERQCKYMERIPRFKPTDHGSFVVFTRGR